MARSDRPGGCAAILTALIIGSANTLKDDLDRARALFTPDMVIGCNHAARDYPERVDHWVTMHPDLFPMWIAARNLNGFPGGARLWSARHRPVPRGLESTPVESWGGSSGLLCVAVAQLLGVERAVLAGVPMLKTACHYDDAKRWEEARAYQPAWEKRAPFLREWLKSMSGWTCDLLGEPTGDWLVGNATRPTS